MADQDLARGPSADELTSARTALAALKERIAALEVAVLRCEEAEAEPAAPPPLTEDAPAARLPKKRSCIFLAYNGHGFSVRKPRAHAIPDLSGHGMCMALYASCVHLQQSAVSTAWRSTPVTRAAHEPTKACQLLVRW